MLISKNTYKNLDWIKMSEKRPSEITELAFLVIIGGIVSMAIFLSSVAGYIDYSLFVSYYAFWGILCFISAYGLLTGKKWSQITIWLLAAFILISRIWNAVNNPSQAFDIIFGILLLAIVIYVFTRPAVKSYFGKT